MTPGCPHCGPSSRGHVLVTARAASTWRGPSFDAEQAKANLAVAVAEALGADVRSPAGMSAFLADVRVEAAPSGAPGEWRFHVAFLRDLPTDSLARAGEAAVRAVNASRRYAGAELR